MSLLHTYNYISRRGMRYYILFAHVSGYFHVGYNTEEIPYGTSNEHLFRYYTIYLERCSWYRRYFLFLLTYCSSPIGDLETEQCRFKFSFLYSAMIYFLNKFTTASFGPLVSDYRQKLNIIFISGKKALY